MILVNNYSIIYTLLMDNENQNNQKTDHTNHIDAQDKQQQAYQPKIDSSSIYPDTTRQIPVPNNSNSLSTGSSSKENSNKKFFTAKIIVFVLVLFLLGGGGALYYLNSNKSSESNIGQQLADSYVPNFEVYKVNNLPDDSYYLEGVLTEDTKPVGVKSGIMLQYRSKNIPKNSDYTLDSSIIQIREEKKRNSYQPPESCANLDEVPVNKTSCKEVGKTDDGKPIYTFSSTANPPIYFEMNGTIIGISMPGNKTASVDDLLKIANSLSPISYDILLQQVSPI